MAIMYTEPLVDIPMLKIPPPPMVSLQSLSNSPQAHTPIPEWFIRISNKDQDIDNTPMLFSNETICSILNLLIQDHNDYHTNTRLITDGFIELQQQEITSIIPSVINDLCLSYYYQKEYKYIHLTYYIYKMLVSTDTDLFNEKELLSIITADNMLQHQFKNKNAKEICNELMELNMINLVSFQTTFMSLFDETEDGRVPLMNYEDCNYRLCDGIMSAFKHYMKTNISGKH